MIATPEQHRITNIYKIYHDGSHYVASGYFPSRKDPEVKQKRTTIEEPELSELYQIGSREGLRRTKLRDFMVDNMVTTDPMDRGVLFDRVEEYLDRQQHNLAARIKRFRRKAYLNPWQYFVTFTYDDQKQSEESFRAGLRKCLSNLHTRRGWRYMGTFERAPETGRLHFHGLLYVPEGQMIGELTERTDYSKALRKRVKIHQNSFFAARFGRNDFDEINEAELKHGKTLDYILKYISKCGERIIYSRGIPTEIYKEIPEEEQAFAAEMFDFVTKYVLFDDVIDWETDVAFFRKVEKEKILKGAYPPLIT